MSADPTANNAPLTPAEMQAIADRARFRAYSSLIGAGVSMIAMITFVVIALFLLGSSNHGNELSSQAQCTTKYTSILKGPTTDRGTYSAEVAALTGSLDSQLGAALLDEVVGQPIPPTIIATFTATRTQLALKTAQLNESIEEVNAEPSLTSATTHGFTFKGTHYPACPVVH